MARSFVATIKIRMTTTLKRILYEFPLNGESSRVKVLVTTQQLLGISLKHQLSTLRLTTWALKEPN
jgi:hypothetical protein